MISQNQFNFIKSKYQYWSSWAIWADQGDTPKSNVGDLSVLDPNTNPKLLSTLNPNIALVALNISRGDITLPFGNFHDARSEATDYKMGAVKLMRTSIRVLAQPKSMRSIIDATQR